MERKTISLTANQLGEASTVVELEGTLEKIVIYHKNESVEDAITHITISSEAGEVVLAVVGNTSKAYYPRASLFNVSQPFTFDGSYPIPTRYYIKNHLKVELKSIPETEVSSISFYFEPTVPKALEF